MSSSEAISLAVWVKKLNLLALSSGTVAYSPQITNGMNITTAGGGSLTFATNVSYHSVSFL